MIANTAQRRFDVVEITNEMPENRIGGVGSVIESLMSGLDQIGVQALWFLTDHQYQPYEVEAILASGASVAVGSYPELGLFSAPVAHIHSYNHPHDLLSALPGAHSLFTIHSLLAYEESSNQVDLHDFVRGQERLIAACDEVALVSRSEHDYYERLGYNRLNERVSVVHNGIGTPRERLPRTRRGVLGFCGRLVPRKHPEYVQMILCEPGFEGMRTLIAGKAFSRYARDLVAGLGIGERVDYLGWCGGPRLEAFYDAIDVLVQPSSYEPFGLAALEAAARRIPVVCTRVDGLAEVLGDYAFYCEDTSYEAFCDAMNRWRAADPSDVDAITAGARQRALAHFTDVAMARRYQLRFQALRSAARAPRHSV